LNKGVTLDFGDSGSLRDGGKKKKKKKDKEVIKLKEVFQEILEEKPKSRKRRNRKGRRK